MCVNVVNLPQMIHCLISTKITSINCKTSLVCYFITTKITKIICRTSLVQICVDIIHLFEQHTTTSDIDIPPGGGTLIPPKGGGGGKGVSHMRIIIFFSSFYMVKDQLQYTTRTRRGGTEVSQPSIK